MKYMKNKRDNKKAFFRVLKELGLYTEWTKCRRKRIEQLKINNRSSSFVKNPDTNLLG